MKLNPDIFAVDAQRCCSVLEAFILNAMTEMKCRGIAVPVSGGLDSSVVTALCVRAVGAEKVTGVLLPEKNGNPDAEKFARRFARDIRIRTMTIPVSRMMKVCGAYDFITEKIPFRRILKKLVPLYIARSGKNLFLEGLRRSEEPMVVKGMAAIHVKQRVRMIAVCRYAELHSLMTAGSAHLSEDMLGLFVPFGVDDCADIMPLKNLYRTQILQIARHIGIPGYILERTPNPDMMPGIDDKYFDILGIHSETADLVLAGLNAGMTAEDISTQLLIPGSAVETIREILSLSSHMRNPSKGVLID
ncbi:MAG: ammonia-dependent NAD(+) synthetase [Spirochaetota bacterium]